MSGERNFRVMTPRPNRRPTLIYRRWRDMQSRCKGQATKQPDKYKGVELGFKSFAEFRAFALKNGFSKENNSPDRIDTSRGYVPGNIRFVPPAENALRGLYPDYFEQYAYRYAAARCECGRNADPHEEWCPDYVDF